MINPGELNKRISFISAVEQDEHGYPIETPESPEPLFECWAKFTRTSGTEMIKSNADFENVNVRFVIRYTQFLIDRKMTIQYNSESYEIVYINDYGDRHKYIEIVAKKVGL